MKQTQLKRLATRFAMAFIAITALIFGFAPVFGADIIPNSMSVATYTTGAPGSIAASTTDSSTVVTIDCRRVQNLPVMTEFKTLSTTTNTSGLTWSIYRSLNGSDWETTAWASYSLAANSTNTVRGMTNINCAGVPWLKIATYANGNSAQTLTNILVKIGSKAEMVATKPAL